MGGWDDADMGTWNDTAQQTNSSWNSATGWNKDKRNIIAKVSPLSTTLTLPHTSDLLC